MTVRERILLESKAWAQEKILLDKKYFNRLAAMQNPNILWIGSSDSLVPVKEITNTDPGEILVYRNFGNLVKEHDLSLMAVLEDALEVNEIKYIVVCGYSHCSSLREVIHGTERPFTREWLLDLKKTYELHHKELDPMPYEQKEQRLAELNIQQQIINLSRLPIIQKAWQKSIYPKLYGWYFNLTTGSFTEVASHEDGAEKPVSIP